MLGIDARIYPLPVRFSFALIRHSSGRDGEGSLEGVILHFPVFN
jgi:hypothetical protein